MPYGYGSDSDCESRNEYEPTEDDLFYDLKDNLSYDYSNGASTEKVKRQYDREICHFSEYFLKSALKGVTPDEYFTQHLLPYLEEQKTREEFHRQCELDEQREYESSPEYAFECFHWTVSGLIFRSEITEAREFYDAEISHHDLSFLDGLTPDAYFDRLVEQDAQRKAYETKQREYEFECFHSNMLELLSRLGITEARKCFDAEISRNHPSFPDGVTPDAYFARLVEQDAEKKAYCARVREEARLTQSCDILPPKPVPTLPPKPVPTLPPKPVPTQMDRDTWEIQRIWDDLSLDLSVKKDAIWGFKLKYGHDESVRIMKPILYFMSEEQIISFLG
jgi:hypothetical protein